MAANQENDAHLQELSKLVSMALGTSDELALNLVRLFRQGYSLRLDFLGKADKEVDREAVLRSLSNLTRSLAATAPASSELNKAPAPTAATTSFRLDARDVAFLQSIGIDGTRRAKRSRRQ